MSFYNVRIRLGFFPICGVINPHISRQAIPLYPGCALEMGDAISITTVTPGVVESEFTKGKCLGKEGEMEILPELIDVSGSYMCSLIQID